MNHLIPTRERRSWFPAVAIVMPFTLGSRTVYGLGSRPGRYTVSKHYPTVSLVVITATIVASFVARLLTVNLRDNQPTRNEIPCEIWQKAAEDWCILVIGIAIFFPTSWKNHLTLMIFYLQKERNSKKNKGMTCKALDVYRFVLRTQQHSNLIRSHFHLRFFILFLFFFYFLFFLN